MRHSDSVDDDLLLLRQPGLVHCIAGFAVSLAVGQHYNDIRHSIAAAVGAAEHRPGDAQCSCDVRLSAVYVDVVDGVQQRLTVAVSVEVENNLRTAAELHQANLRQVVGDGKRAGDSFGKTQYSDVPVLIKWIADNDACGLVKHQHYVSRSRTRNVRH